MSPGFVPSRLVNLPEPHASVLELFVRVRGNAKEVERELGLSYPTVRARLDEAFAAAQSALEHSTGAPPISWRTVILEALERGVLTPAEAVARLHAGLRREGLGAPAATAVERKRVLAMVAAGDLTTDDADPVLEALAGVPLPPRRATEGARDTAAAVRPSGQVEVTPTAPRWRTLVVRATEHGEAKVHTRLPLELAREADRFLPRQARHYFAECGVDLNALLKSAGGFERVRGTTASRWDALLRRLAKLPGDGTLAHVEDGGVELTITLE